MKDLIVAAFFKELDSLLAPSDADLDKTAAPGPVEHKDLRTAPWSLDDMDDTWKKRKLERDQREKSRNQ